MQRLRLGIGLALAALIASLTATAGDEQLTLYKGKSIAAWVAAVKEPSGRFNVDAIRVLAELGPDARDAVPVLIESLNDKEAFWDAADTLAAIGPDAKAAIPALIAHIRKPQNDSFAYRPQVCKTLARIGEPALPSLKEMIKEKDVMGEYAALAMGDMGEAGMTALIAVLCDKSATVRAHAASAMASMNPGAKEALVPLIQALSDDDPVVRREAASALGAIGPEAKEAVPYLKLFLRKEQDRDMRITAIRALGGVSDDAAFLIELSKDNDQGIRNAAIGVLREFHPAATAPFLIDALKDKNKDVRQIAARKLGNWGQSASPAVPALTAALKDNDWEVRQAASEALGNIGPAAADAVPALVDALKDKNPDVRVTIADALSKIDPENQAPIPVLLAALTGKEIRLRFDAAKALGLYGQTVTAPVVEALGSADAGVRAAALCALGEVEPGTKATVRLLIAALSDKDEEVRRIAVLLLAQFAPAAKEAVEPLTAALKDDSWEVRAGAALALGRIGAPARDAVPSLITVLKEAYEWGGARWSARKSRGGYSAGVVEVRGNAAFALGRIGRDAKEASAALVTALGDKEHQVRNAAAWALARVGPDPKLAVRPLIALLQDTECAALALGEIGPEAREAVAPLADALRYGWGDVKGSAAWALGRIGPEAKAAVPALHRFLNTPAPAPRRMNFGVQTGIQFPEDPPLGPVMPPLYSLLKNDERDARGEAAAALKQLDHSAAP